MPRVARIKSKSKIYHIVIRGINQQNIFSVDEHDEKFMAILAKYHKKENPIGSGLEMSHFSNNKQVLMENVSFQDLERK